MMRRLLSFCRDRKASAAAEMALMLPLLVLLLFGALEAGYFLWSEHKVVKGVRDGARYAGRQGFAIVDCASGTFTDSNAITAIKNVTRTGTADGSNDPTVPGWTDAQVSISITCDASTKTGIYEAEPNGAPLVTVSATVPYPTLFGYIAFDLSGIDLNAKAEAAVMGV